MSVEILHVADCPGAALLEARLARARPDVAAGRRLVESTDDAVATGMAGSPTLLVDGADPFAGSGEGPSLACRRYRGDDGTIDTAPSVEQLRRALAPLLPRRCGIALDPAQRATLRAILAAFAVTGRPPQEAELDAGTLRALHEADAIRLDARGRIAVAYPFSATPTRHLVRVAGGVVLHAMCALDALGVPAMLDADATIRSLDPLSGEPIHAVVRQGRARWEPPTAVAFVPASVGDGPSAECCCGQLDLFVDEASARAWMASHPGVRGALVAPDELERAGRRTFGSLL